MANVLSQADQGGAPTPEAPRDPLSIPNEVKASIRVLVVDDERTLRESCASVLQMDGYNVTVIGRGEEAILSVGVARPWPRPGDVARHWAQVNNVHFRNGLIP